MRHIDVEALQDQGVSHNLEIMKRVIVSNGQIDNLTNFAMSRFAPGQVAPGHAHADMSEVFYCVAGQGQVRFAQSTATQSIVTLSGGECVVIEPGEWHELSNCTDKEWILLYFGVLTGASKASG